MLISQTFRGSATLEKKAYYLLQKWYMLSEEKKHEIIKDVADGLREGKPGNEIRNYLERDIDKAIPDAMIDSLHY